MIGKKLTVRDIIELKESGDKIVMLTAYDASFGRLLDRSGVEPQAVPELRDQDPVHVVDLYRRFKHRCPAAGFPVQWKFEWSGGAGRADRPPGCSFPPG